MSRYLETLREAKMTLLSLMLLMIFWLLAGMSVGIEVTAYGIPIWAIIGTVGVWTFGIIIAITLSRSIKDIEL